MHEARADEPSINRDTRPARLAKVLWVQRIGARRSWCNGAKAAPAREPQPIIVALSDAFYLLARLSSYQNFCRPSGCICVLIFLINCDDLMDICSGEHARFFEPMLCLAVPRRVLGRCWCRRRAMLPEDLLTRAGSEMDVSERESFPVDRA
jgi:hypothetical protein